jgi:UDPglucose--hexose-1-phosphate uridylyltransferase
MPQYRRDPFTGSWVIMAPDRAGRPNEFFAYPRRRTDRTCPFCRGNEVLAPSEIACYPATEDESGRHDWQVRVIANKYPAVSDGTGELSEQETIPGELFCVQPGDGVHEVIVESPQHSASFSELTPVQAYWSFVAYRDRLRAMANIPGLAYGLIFKNCRAGGGATLEHSHSQMVATTLVPVTVQQELGAASAYYESPGGCIYCELLRRELEAGHRIVAASDHFAALCPFASRFPYETWILPRRHDHRFEDANLDELVGTFTFLSTAPALPRK